MRFKKYFKLLLRFFLYGSVLLIFVGLISWYFLFHHSIKIADFQVCSSAYSGGLFQRGYAPVSLTLDLNKKIFLDIERDGVSVFYKDRIVEYFASGYLPGLYCKDEILGIADSHGSMTYFNLNDGKEIFNYKFINVDTIAYKNVKPHKTDIIFEKIRLNYIPPYHALSRFHMH